MYQHSGFNTGIGTKAIRNRRAQELLVRDVILAPNFVPSDVAGLDWHRMDQSLAADTTDTSTGWKSDTLPLDIPPRNWAKVAEFKANPERGTLVVPNFRHRSLVSTVKDAFSNNDRQILPLRAIYCKMSLIMVFSNATQLATFGHATAWPIGIAFGNLFKYERCKPNSRNHYELGFIPSLPADLQEKIRNARDSRPVPKPLLTHPHWCDLQRLEA
ncbi:hypothetical protein BDV93DRAFT_514476 [Ceratobasidium sp. AG-I]|nr:hypothetical protein BDV93DRAFT_514476 [Ceratobasidium sp. AG-I]